MLADQDEPLTWYDEEFDQGWCRFEDHQGRSYWHLLTTDHTQWEPPWLSRRSSVRRADRGVPAPQLVFFVEVIQLSCVAGEIVVFLCHRSRPAVDVERAAVRGFRHGRFRLHGGMLDNGFPLAEMDCVWSVPACNGDLMDNGVASPVMNACAPNTATVLEPRVRARTRPARWSFAQGSVTGFKE